MDFPLNKFSFYLLTIGVGLDFRTVQVFGEGILFLYKNKKDYMYFRFLS